MEKYISITQEQREFIIKAFGVTSRMVNYALSYRKDTALARRIRRLALERGGVRMVAVNEIECIHDADGVMTQLMPNGAVIKIDRNTGDAKVYYNGKPVICVDNIRAREIAALQESAMALK